MKAAWVGLAVTLASFTGATAQPSEMQQRMACMGDALRLCPQYIPNKDQIRRCLLAQRTSLSAGCRPVFDASEKAFEATHR